MDKLLLKSKKIAEMIEANQTAQDTMNRKLAEFEDKLVNVERSFLDQVVPLLALFVGAFALIVSGAGATMHITAGDPVQVAAQSAAIMGPVTLAVLVLIGAAWLVSRRR